MALISVTHAHQTSKPPAVTIDKGVVMIQWGELRATLPADEARALAAAITDLTA